MILNSAIALSGMMAMGQPAGNGQSTAPWYWNMLMPGLLLFAFYFAILRPQKNRQKNREEKPS